MPAQAKSKPLHYGLAGLVLFALLAGPACERQVSREQASPIPAERPTGPASTAEPVTIFLCGDVMTGRGIDQVLPHPGDPQIQEPVVQDARDYVALAEEAHGPIQEPVEFSYIWGDALGELERVRPDVRIVNLETSVTTSDDYWPGKGIHYRMSPQNVPCLTAARIDCCVLANNHVLDWGYAGLTETLETLRGPGILTTGAGQDLAEAEAPAVIEVEGGERVLVYSYGVPTSGIPAGWGAAQKRAGVSLLADLSDRAVQRVKQSVEAAKRPGDVVVVSVHWGSNWGYEIPPEQVTFAHALIDDAGVDVVHGHSSHHVKGIEVYRGRLVLYGCGDFLNDYEGIRGYEQFRSDLALMYFASVDPSTGALVRLQMTPMQTRQLRANRASRTDVLWLRNVLNREGKRFGTWVELGPDDTFTLRWEGG